jgi:hypothetical protein
MFTFSVNPVRNCVRINLTKRLEIVSLEKHAPYNFARTHCTLHHLRCKLNFTGCMRIFVTPTSVVYAVCVLTSCKSSEKNTSYRILYFFSTESLIQYFSTVLYTVLIHGTVDVGIFSTNVSVTFLQDILFFPMTRQPLGSLGRLIFRGFTITHIRHTTLGRTPLDKGPARRRDLYLTTHNTHNRQTSMP